MQDPDFISLFVAPLERAGIRYMITGSVASSIYGEPRNTLDIDLVVLLEKNHFALLKELFPENDFYLPPLEVIAIEAKREAHGHFNIIHHTTGFKADIYLSRNHPYFFWAIAHARRAPTPTGEITIAPPEYVILHKLDFYRESGHPRHLRDIAGMLEQQNLDQEFLNTAVKELGLTTQWSDATSLEDQ
jgi:hypothetical protein